MQPKAYYNLIDDAPTAADKKREAGLAKSLSEKEKKPVMKVSKIVIKKTEKAEKPLSEKERLAGLAEELGKENFYGTKPEKRKLDEVGKRAISDARSEAIIKRANALIAARKRMEEEKNKKK